MNNYVITAKAEATIEFSEIADEFANMGSGEQAIFLHELFDSLRHKCKDHFKNETQLLYISNHIKEMNFKQLSYTFETINEFLKTKEGE